MSGTEHGEGNRRSGTRKISFCIDSSDSVWLGANKNPKGDATPCLGYFCTLPVVRRGRLYKISPKVSAVDVRTWSCGWGKTPNRATLEEEYAGAALRSSPEPFVRRCHGARSSTNALLPVFAACGFRPASSNFRMVTSCIRSDAPGTTKTRPPPQP